MRSIAPPDLAHPSLTSRPVIESPWLRDGVVLVDRTAVLVGTRPLTDLQAAAREARLLVRRGMADVLVWLGEPVYNEPTGREILDAIAALADDSPVVGRHAA